MITAFNWFTLIAIAAGALAVVAIPVGFQMRPVRQSRLGIGIAAAPSLLMLVLFYSLALHMHHALGKWPESIGENGFPSLLVTHGSIAVNYFGVWLLVAVFVWPITFVMCLAVRRWRAAAYYLAVYILSGLAGFGLLLLAPSPFLNWWWD